MAIHREDCITAILINCRTVWMMYRMNRKKVHKMETIIYISIAAVICGAQSWNEIEEFGNAKITFFKSRIPDLESIPSHDTFNRFFRIIKPEYFELIFRNWVKQVCQEVKGVVM